MAKKRRAAAKKKKKKKAPTKRKAVGKAKIRRPRAKRPAAPVPSPEALAAQAAAAARRRKAIAAYERGLKAMQRRDFRGAATAFTSVLEEFPAERELHDRCRLYLQVCARETVPQAPRPSTPDELVYAATVALNNAAHDESLGHLRQAIGQDADDERAHYMLAVVYAQTDQLDLAVTHLERAVELEPENRLVARQEPDFESLREHERVQQLLEPPPARRRARRPTR